MKVTGQFIKEPIQTKKGDFMRSFLTEDQRNVFSVWSKNKSDLEKPGKLSLEVDVQELVFFRGVC